MDLVIDSHFKYCREPFLQATEQGAVASIPADKMFEVAEATIKISHLLREQG